MSTAGNNPMAPKIQNSQNRNLVLAVFFNDTESSASSILVDANWINKDLESTGLLSASVMAV